MIWFQQVVVAGDNIICLDFQGAGQKLVVPGIGFELIRPVEVCSDNKSFFSYQAYD